MKFGITFPNFGPYGDVAVLVDLAERAEAAGWDGIFVWDHIQVDPEWGAPFVDPWIAMSAMAVATTRIALGPMVTPVSRRRPAQLARQTVSLDHLSGGRLVLGVGLGWPPGPDFADLGDESDPRIRAEMLDEGLDLIDALWSGELVEHSGTHYTARGVRFLPRPLQQPRIPIWVAGFWPHKAPFRRMARWDGMFPLNSDPDSGEAINNPPETLADMVGYVMDHRSAEGPFDVVAMVESPRDATERARLRAEYAAAGMTWWIEYLGEDDAPLTRITRLIDAGPLP